jgi:hypothetical protein
MNSTQKLSGGHLRTYDTIFQHPVSHNLKWHDVRTLLAHLGEMVMEPNGNLKVTRNGEQLVMHPPRTKDVAEAREVMEIRHFLERSDRVAQELAEQESHWLVVINHQEALIYRTEVRGAVPHQIKPLKSAEHFRRGHESREFPSGKEKPAQNSFFEPVAQALKEASHILVFGAGTGTSSEMEQFSAWVKKHHPELARRISGLVVIDEGHATEPELLAKAREFYAHNSLKSNDEASHAEREPALA